MVMLDQETQNRMAEKVKKFSVNCRRQKSEEEAKKKRAQRDREVRRKK